jgi:cell pole-organizing protein PopZ
MSAEQAQREPTMEEILASIRRIISEEDKPADAGGDVLDLQPPPAPVVEAKAPPVAAPAPAPQPIPAVFEEEEPAPPARPIEDDLMVVEDEEPVFTPPPAPTPEPVRAAAPAPAPEPVAPQAEWRPMEQKTLTSEPVASQAAGALSKLMGSMLVSSGATLDDVVRELLKPMLKQWLDANLPQIVEAEVAKEIDRIRRMAR